jgi:lipopolysaccharide transport system permease protein
MRDTIRLSGMLGWQDVRQAYRRSAIGPFWITAGMAVQIATMGVVFGLIFKTDLTQYLPFLAVSIILWGFISSVLNDGCTSFITAEAIIKQLNISMLTHVLRVIWKNMLTLGHNLVILPVVFLAMWQGVGWEIALFIPGCVILLANLTWMVLLLGMVSARFRDMPPIVNSLLTIAFYVTPVMWFPSLIGDNALAHLMLGLNPFYHLLQLVRLPLLGGFPTLENWGLSILLAVIGWIFAFLMFKKFRAQIAYWV